MDVAQYSIKPSLKRMLFPSFLKLLALSVAFFGGILINLRLLSIKPPMVVIILIIVVLFALSAVQVLLTHVNLTKIRYDFFPNRVDKQGVKLGHIFFSQVQGLKFKRSALDKIFGTGTIVMLPNFRIEKVPNAKQVFYYVQQLVQRSGGVTGIQQTQPQYQQQQPAQQPQQQYQQPQQPQQRYYPQ